MKTHKKGGASAPKDKNMEYKNGLAKKTAGAEAARFALYESQNDFITGKKPFPKNGVGTYAMHAQNMRRYERKKIMQEKHAVGKMSRKERKDYKAALANNEKAMVIEKTVYLVFPLTKESHFYRTVDGANNQLNKKYDAWIMSELQCNYEDIQIISMKESEAMNILKEHGCVII